MSLPDSQLSVQIDVKIAEIELDINQVNSLVEGELVSLNRNLPPQVDLIYNNKTIAKGILINLDGRIGVKISQILNANEERDCDTYE